MKSQNEISQSPQSSAVDNLISAWHGAKKEASQKKNSWREAENQMLNLTNRLGDALLPTDSRPGDTFIFQVAAPGLPAGQGRALLITKISETRHLGESNFNIRWKA